MSLGFRFRAQGPFKGLSLKSSVFFFGLFCGRVFLAVIGGWAAASSSGFHGVPIQAFLSAV